MNESEWLASTDPSAMLRLAMDNPDHQDINCCRSDRKLWLWCLACRLGNRARGPLGMPTDWGYIQTEASDGQRCEWDLGALLGSWKSTCGDTEGDLSLAERADLLRDIAGNPFRAPTFDPAWRTPTVLDLAQAAYEERTEANHLDPLRLAMLADALEEAGCPLTGLVLCGRCDGSGMVGSVNDREDCPACPDAHPGSVVAPSTLLAHLRSPGPHVRGCWALDLVLGKE